MGDGISWYYQNIKEQNDYKKHVDSGKFNKEYIESDIIRVLTQSEIRLLVVRLIIHNLGGAEKFFKNNFAHEFHKSFNKLSKKDKIRFLRLHAKDVGLTINEDKRIKKLQNKIYELRSIMEEEC
jgi:hypothetical protein